jgi:transcriptional regulator with XRE-family HTH domain
MPHTQTITFGNDIRQRREYLGLTRERLAHKIGCAAVTIYKIEINERRPSIQIAELLARHLDVPEADIEAFIKHARQQPLPSEPEAVQPNNAARSAPSSLPASLIALMGRDEELRYLLQLLTLPDARLITLTGSPGVGKTQLALAVARTISQRTHYKEGCVLIPLAALGRTEDIPATILMALGETPVDEAPAAVWHRSSNILR